MHKQWSVERVGETQRKQPQRKGQESKIELLPIMSLVMNKTQVGICQDNEIYPNKASDSKLLLAIQVWVFCRVTNIMKESAHCNFSTDCKILITSLTSTVVKYYYFGKQKISIFKMESLETAEKALRLSLLS